MSVMRPRTKVMIVDDSAVVRQTLSALLDDERDIEVIATAADPYIAAKKLRREVPDVIILDLQMPRMDGITFLREIMAQHPIPVVICSSYAEKGSQAALRAMDLGAVAIVSKPRLGARRFLEESRVRICDAVRAANMAKPITKSRVDHVQPRRTADVIVPRRATNIGQRKTERIVVVGASTGGTDALRVFLSALPADCPGVVVVQHMPAGFTKAFADRLNETCEISVKEAESLDPVLPGHALIAPGNRHVVLQSSRHYYVDLKDGPLVCRHRPSVDVLFRSAAHHGGANAIGVIMTGMGNDGSAGMLELKESGAATIAQDEASSVIFGMPQEAIKVGAVDTILPLQDIAREVVKLSVRCGHLAVAEKLLH